MAQNASGFWSTLLQCVNHGPILDAGLCYILVKSSPDLNLCCAASQKYQHFLKSNINILKRIL